MGDEAEEIRDDLTPEDNQAEDDIEIDTGEVEGEAGEGNSEGEDAAPQFTQQQLDEIVQKRIARLGKKKGQSDEESARLARELEIEREKNKLLELERQQRAKPAGPPNPDEFDEGEFDPAYRKALATHQEQVIADKVARQVAEANQQATAKAEANAAAQRLQSVQVAHYQKANELNMPDFADIEDKAIEAIGQDAHNVIMGEFDNSHLIMAHLGKNAEAASRVAAAIKASPVKGVAEITRISDSLKSKRTSSKAPNPTERLEGSTASSIGTSLARLQKSYEAGKIDMKTLLAKRKALRGD